MTTPPAPPAGPTGPRPVSYKSWGLDLEPESIRQMDNACRLPVAAAAALMPDAHVGYGLPIGGVLATRGAVIPYAVGVDIACRMRMSVLDLPLAALDKPHERRRLIKSLESQTRFGVGGSFDIRNQHDVMDLDWKVSPVTRDLKDKAWSQLGTSGSGNHFVEYGALTLDRPAPELGLDPGIYLALLSHSGSRGTGAAVCQHYSALARNLRPDLPKELSYLAWLDLASQPGREYWDAMNLMGRYAAANHELIHRRIAKDLGVEAIAHIENHHNFAWKETHDLGDGPEDLIVHRKGATPAGKGVLGVIPGSMATPGFIVRGLGSAESLHSASHGAGRVMSRTKAREKYRFHAVAKDLLTKGVEVLSAGADEVPYVYKDIHAVMARQRDLVEPIARFDPRIVKMAPAGEKPED